MYIPTAMTNSIVLQAGDEVILTSYNSLDMAGEMSFMVYRNGTFLGDFDTFCIQDNVYIGSSTAYYVGRVSDDVGYLGPQPTDPGPNGGWGPLDYQVAYLFSQFDAGAFNSYFGGANGKAYQADFQNSLWNFQGSGSIGYVSEYPNALLNLDLDNALPGNSYPTDVLNLTTGFDYQNMAGTGSDVQNMLIDPQVPELSSLTLPGFRADCSGVGDSAKEIELLHTTMSSLGPL